jgi:hypothetical protein
MQCFHYQRLDLDYEATADINMSLNATVQVTVVPEVHRSNTLNGEDRSRARGGAVGGGVNRQRPETRHHEL